MGSMENYTILVKINFNLKLRNYYKVIMIYIYY